MKKLSTVLVLSLFLASCSLSSTETTLTGNTNVYETANFQINYPLDWEVVDKTRFETSIPENIIVAFRSNIKNETFTTNLNISLDVFDQEVNTKDFGLSTLSLASKQLTDFVDIQMGETTVNFNSTKQNAYYIEYEGKSSPKDPLVHFKQVFANKGAVIYTVTNAYLPNEDESIVNLADLMLNSFTLK